MRIRPEKVLTTAVEISFLLGWSASAAPTAKKIDFDKDVKPIFQASCLRCHGPEKPKSHFRLDDRELALVEALRTLRLIHYSAWLARRWDDPAFPIAFPWFNTPRYWQDRILELREQIAAMQEPPLAPA